jgi:hypothetical protein
LPSGGDVRFYLYRTPIHKDARRILVLRPSTSATAQAGGPGGRIVAPMERVVVTEPVVTQPSSAERPPGHRAVRLAWSVRCRRVRSFCPYPLMEAIMARCEVCGNDYHLAFEVITAGQSHVFDSFECAIHKLAPICDHCGCKVIGHGVEANGTFYCCAHCARRSGAEGARDHV